MFLFLVGSLMEQYPRPISTAQQRARLQRVRSLASHYGFVGRVEYRHVASRAGGAQYVIGVTEDQDLLAVYADAFRRDADPEDFSLEAIIAHERGHQLVARDPRLARLLSGRMSRVGEEVLASLIGSVLVHSPVDHEHLVGKATTEAVLAGLSWEAAERLVTTMQNALEEHL